MLALRDQRRSVLDRVKRQMDRMRPRVSQRDRYVIDGHFDAIRDLEKKVACQLPGTRYDELAALDPKNILNPGKVLPA